MWLTSSGNTVNIRNKTKRFGAVSPQPTLVLTLNCLVSGFLSFLWQIRVGKHKTLHSEILSSSLLLRLARSERSAAQFKFSTCFQSSQEQWLWIGFWFGLLSRPGLQCYCRMWDKTRQPDNRLSQLTLFLPFQRRRVRALEMSVQLLLYSTLFFSE